MKTANADDQPRPKSLVDLYMSFTWLALQGFGGALAVAQRELVERKRWLTLEEFAEEWAVAQILPGPNVCNLAVMLGGRHFGKLGAVVALAGMLSIPLVLMLLIALAYALFASHPGVAGALRGMSAVAAGLIAGTGLKFVNTFKTHPLGFLTCAVLAIVVFVSICLLQVPLGYIVLGLGGATCVLTYRKLKP
ncbi:MAG: chromate transporter [Burkholderiaceae bacterium]|nr:chromate transporter [Burkholderiaceae bacterium]